MINIGLIGYGYWGPNLARCFAETERCRLAAVADSSSAALVQAARRYPETRCTTEWDEVVRDTSVDAIAIATPVRTHFSLALAALRAGKHVLIEKPMTETAAQAKLLVAEAADRDLVLLVDHTFCYTPAVQKLRDLVIAGDLGEIYYYVASRMNLGIFRTDVDVIWDLAVHDIAILHHCLGRKPFAVSASGTSHLRGRPANMAHATLFFEDGLVADLNVNWLSPVKIRQSILSGNRCMVVYDDLEPSEKIKIYDRGVNISGDPEEVHQMLVSYRIGDMRAPHLAPTEALLAETRHFRDCIENKQVPITDGNMGLHVVEVLEGATRSMQQRGHPVDLQPLRLAS
jgi:predicted dehydrogenase